MISPVHEKRSGAANVVDVICDSSPLILYSKIGRLALFADLFGTVIVPPAVWDEIISHGANRPDAAAIANAPWIQRVSPSEETALLELTESLGLGEAECIALASQHPSRTLLVIDDKKGRLHANSLGIRTIGSIGVPLLAKDAGLISSVKPTLDDLRAAGLYLRESVLAEALELAGE